MKGAGLFQGQLPKQTGKIHIVSGKEGNRLI